jgi:hypothetical protein
MVELSMSFGAGGLAATCNKHIGCLKRVKPTKKNAIDMAMLSDLPRAMSGRAVPHFARSEFRHSQAADALAMRPRV